MSERAATVASSEDSGRRHRFDRLEDTASDGVWVALGVRTTVFEVAFVTVVDPEAGAECALTTAAW